jgi:hypothetical protein
LDQHEPETDAFGEKPVPEFLGRDNPESRSGQEAMKRSHDEAPQCGGNHTGYPAGRRLLV